MEMNMITKSPLVLPSLAQKVAVTRTQAAQSAVNPEAAAQFLKEQAATPGFGQFAQWCESRGLSALVGAGVGYGMPGSIFGSCVVRYETVGGTAGTPVLYNAQNLFGVPVGQNATSGVGTSLPMTSALTNMTAAGQIPSREAMKVMRWTHFMQILELAAAPTIAIAQAIEDILTQLVLSLSMGGSITTTIGTARQLVAGSAHSVSALGPLAAGAQPVSLAVDTFGGRPTELDIPLDLSAQLPFALQATLGRTLQTITAADGAAIAFTAKWDGPRWFNIPQ